MATYQVPLEDMQFTLKEVAELEKVLSLPCFSDVNGNLIDTILTEAGKFGSDVLYPLRQSGDREGCQLENGAVKLPNGFTDAYTRFIKGGWNSVSFSTKYGGMGLPNLVAGACLEIWQSTNSAFAICPTLTQAAVELISTNGSEFLKSSFLERLVSGEWTGTMNLTEPQAGSDLSNISTKAIKKDGQYFIKGQKIFITFGEHDFTENIIHMVLARSPDNIEGTGGLSLYLVPKYLVLSDGKIGEHNDLSCIALEHKMGLHASPTCVMSFGEKEVGALGFLIGEENRGLEYMFTMMNNARLAIGIQGVGVAEQAYQHAKAYASERIQGKITGTNGESNSTTIDNHPDVKRMLLFMRSSTEAIRSITYFSCALLDLAKNHPNPDERLAKQDMVDFLIPIVKAWASDTGIQITNTAIQVVGGAGYIEESGIPQFFRDLRIASIWEGTNGIQALDLVGRKIARDNGIVANELIKTMRSLNWDSLDRPEAHDLKVISRSLKNAIKSLEDATVWVIKNNKKNPQIVAASATNYLQLIGTVIGGWLMAQSAIAAFERMKAGESKQFLKQKIISSRFFADHILIHAPALSFTITNGWETIIENKN